MNRPNVVSVEEWQAALDDLLVKEKAQTRALEALAAERRRLPMVRLSTDHRFVAPDGAEVGLLDVFDGLHQLVVYHHMLEPGQDWLCEGCTSFTDNIADQVHLNHRDTRLVLMSRASRKEIDAVQARLGYTVPWYSADPSFYEEIRLSGGFRMSVFLRDGDEVFHTYYTSARGVDRLRLDFNLLDLTPFGRQEEWEDSPEGRPQTPTMQWLRIRDEYES
ncbi:DUF899 family protein [Actinosynnema sp. NPDC047251]|uniref:DUF899 domain-containing protein n=1 Tax=Saccharothrix espanaensis (strain ATCC 51144 / DSM 44229 / JCM 9112 / NBRC 15066 / NRRL 15764) TaxID=1179773 RepID=K0JUS8_SACES|nr:DUF899 family protein [Saccharothrix espanaensis]CCH28539.1 hypothetical protein BN6_12130 [Saccharothrix espanaensis DSM 44229]